MRKVQPLISEGTAGSDENNLEFDPSDSDEVGAAKLAKKRLKLHNERLNGKGVTICPRRNLTLIEGKIIYAMRKTLFVFDIQKLINDSAEEGKRPKGQTWRRGLFEVGPPKETWNLQINQCRAMIIQKNYAFTNFIDLEYEDSAMIIENDRTGQVRFLHLTCDWIKTGGVDNQFADAKTTTNELLRKETFGLDNHSISMIHDETKQTKTLGFAQLGLV